MSEVEGLHSFPKTWRHCRLSDFVKHKSGDSKIIKGKQSSTPGYDLVQGFSASGPDVWVGVAQYSGPGVVVSAVGARCGKTFIADGEWTAIANTHVLRPSTEVDNKFLWYLTNREEWWLKSGTAQPFVKVKDSLERPFALPPREEQEQVVRILEEQLSRLDAAVKSVQTVREKAAQFRRSLLHAAFTGKRAIDFELQPSEATFKDVELGELLVDVQSGFASGKHNASGIGVIHIRPMNISRRGVLDFSEKKFVENVGGHRLRRGDVLFNNTNSPALVGKTALVDVDTELAFSNHMTRLRVNESRILSNFLALRLHALWEDGYFESICSNHVNQASVSSKRLTKVTIGVPELSVQRAIVERLHVLLSNLDATLAVADEVERKANALRRSLLHAAFAGELTRSWREAHV